MKLTAADTPTLLVLDAATEWLHLGLATGRQRLTRCLEGGAQSSAALLPALQALLDEGGLDWSAVDGIGFGRGPGAFTGVRTACAVAQGLAFGRGLPVVAIDTLMAVAEDAHASGAGTQVRVAVDARMGETYSAAYRRLDAGGWETVDPPALHEPAALAERIEAGFAVAGSSLLAHADAWATFAGERRPDAAPRAAALLQLALWRWAEGERLDAAQALPHYVRDRVALTTAERESAKAAA